MTNEEAKRIIKSEMCKKCGIYLGGGECHSDCRVIQCIEALSAESCEDAINREDTLNAMLEELCIRNEDYLTPAEATLYKVVKNMTSATPKPKTGHWISIEDRTDWYNAAYKCSCCGREIITPYELKNNLYSDYPYCHCGAKMVEPQEEEQAIEVLAEARRCAKIDENKLYRECTNPND